MTKRTQNVDPLSLRATYATLLDTYATLWNIYATLLVSKLFRYTADEFERVERVVLRGGDEEALAFRRSVTDECKLTAVAVSHH